MRWLPRSPGVQHALAVAVALWAMSILLEYRVLGWSLAAHLPWVGSALVVLNALLLINRFIAPGLREGTIHDVVTFLDRVRAS